MKQQCRFITKNVYNHVLLIIDDDSFLEIDLWHKIYGKLWAVLDYGIKENYESNNT